MIVTTRYPLQITLNLRLLLPFPNIRIQYVELAYKKSKIFHFQIEVPLCEIDPPCSH